MRTLALPVMLALLALPSAGAPPAPGPKPNPFAQHALPTLQRAVIHGEVLEQLNAGSYTYLRVRLPDGTQAWLVSLASRTQAPARVTAFVIGRAERFHSPRLRRDFNPLLFAAVRGEGLLTGNP